MKPKRLAVISLVALAAIIGFLAAAQTSTTNSGPVRFVEGVAYYPEKDPRWKNREGECFGNLPEGIIVRVITNPGRYIPPDVDKMQSIGAYVDPRITGSRVGRTYGQSFLVRNYRDTRPAQAGELVRCVAMSVGVKVIGNQKMEVWDCGLPEGSKPVPQGALPETWKPRVMADIELAGQSLTIKNRDKTDWPQLTVILETADHSNFEAPVPLLKAGESGSVSLTNFSNKAGETLNPTNSFRKVSIGGNGFQFGAYGL